MTCKELIELLAEYLEGTLASELGRELEAHLEDCRPCQAYLATYRRTVEIGREAARVEMPEEMKQRLREFLLKHLRDETT